MQSINNYIIEKLKVSKDTNDSPSEFYELAKIYDLWYRRQKSKYPEISLKGIYRSNKIIVTNPRQITDDIVIELYKEFVYHKNEE